MKHFIKIHIFLLFSFSFKLASAQVPTYNLTAKNFTLGSINHQNDALYFDVYLEWTNPGVVPNFELAGQQLYFSFNRNILTAPFPSGTQNIPDTSNYSCKIIGSELPVSMVPRKPALYTASNPTADIIRTAINSFPGAGFGFLIQPGFPGTKLCRFRIWNKSASFATLNFNLAWRNPPIISLTTKIFAYVGTTNTDITTPNTHFIDSAFSFNPPAVMLNLNCIPEGKYFKSFNLIASRDSISTFLREANSPYLLIDSSVAVVDSVSFSGIFTFPNAASGRYYIVVKHKQCIETWSRSGGDSLIFNQVVNYYDFTISASQAYGDNTKLKGLKYCLISGDITQDGIIDGSDFLEIDNNAYSFAAGRYLNTDLNGDNVIDAEDMQIADNNRSRTVISP